MHPTVAYEANQARIAELHHQAQRDRLAYATRRAARTRRPRLGDHLPKTLVLAVRRSLTIPRIRTP
jgi:hypothetical protein